MKLELGFIFEQTTFFGGIFVALISDLNILRWFSERSKM